MLDIYRACNYAPSMHKNLTLKLETRLLNRARHVAVDEETSLSAWVKGLIEHAVEERDTYAASRKQALAHLAKGFSLGGRALTRDQAHER